MVQITFNTPEGTSRTVVATPGTSVMQAAVSNGVPGIDAECGGAASCATCHVYVAAPWLDRLPPVGDDENEMLDCTAGERRPTSRLSCQIPVEADLDGLVVDVPEAQS